MKKLTVFIVLVLLLLAGQAWATDAVSISKYYFQEMGLKVVEIDWTDSPNAALSATDTDIDKFMRGWWVYKAETAPGTGGSQPDDDYDIALNMTAFGVTIDIMGGELGDRDETTHERAFPKVDASYAPVHIISGLTLVVTGQTTAAATGTIVLYLYQYD